MAYFRSYPLGRLGGGRSLLSKGLLRFVLFMLSGCKIYKPSIQQDDLFFARRLYFKKKLMESHIWNIAFYGAETWTLGKTH